MTLPEVPRLCSRTSVCAEAASSKSNVSPTTGASVPAANPDEMRGRRTGNGAESVQTRRERWLKSEKEASIAPAAADVSVGVITCTSTLAIGT